MDLLTSARQAAALDRLAALEVADAQLMAARARALVDYDELCRAQPAADRAVEFIALDIATACTIAQVTATIRLEQARRLIQDLHRPGPACSRASCTSGRPWRSWTKPSG